ncbi:glycosyltransferase [Solemya elarraichensis gill symbiont]|uniref:glycosyltransferase n=1 Tax=Solemya elarraichensis gill symbiont TaxID=1918949 RepID=UPI001428C96D|nr:glycosyltransferase [Solemya elarraichensis gill symbiont]
MEKHTLELCSELANRGHTVTLIADPIFQERIPDGVLFLPVSMKRWRNNPLFLYALWNAIKNSRSDVIHAQANKAAAIVGKLRAFLKPPMIATVHNQKRSVRMFGYFDRLIAVSKGVAISLPADSTSVIYNGIKLPQPRDLSRNLAHLFDLNSRHPVLVSIGRLVPAKGFDILIDAISGLDASLVIIGEGSERQSLEEKIHNLDLGKQVKLAGFRDDISDLIAASDGVVIASRVEGFSYVFAETMLLRMPVVATEVPVANEVLSENDLVTRDNPGALHSRLQEKLADMSGWRAQQSAAFEFAEQHFTLDAMVSSVENIYSQAITG